MTSPPPGAGGPPLTQAAQQAARRLAQANTVAVIAFILGGALFALGAALAQQQVGSVRQADLVYLAGGFWFSAGGYVSVVQASNTPVGTEGRGTVRAASWRWWAWQPRQTGWLSAAVLFAGTVSFGVSLVAAFASDLTARQADVRIWIPDMIGCVCFLVSGHLALLEVCHGRPRLQLHDLGWWVVAVNQLGSVLFFLAGLAAFVRPATSTAVNLALVNWGTCAGAVCFVAGGALQLRERPNLSPSPRPG